MAGRIRDDDIRALARHADFVAVVGDHTRLQRAGTRLKGLCPFHQERTPSFTVDPQRGLYHCFGCGAGGDVYTFLQQVEGLQFVEAVELLARRTGFQLHYEDLSAGERRALGDRSRWVGLTKAAHAFYRAALYSDEGQAARAYLKGRGFGRDEAEAFELGFAPLAWDRLSRHLVTDGFDARDLVTVGLATRNDRGGLRDRFRGRLLFPIHDVSGDVLGFGGRVLPGLDYGRVTPPKYYNSPESPLYHKQRVLYGLPQARSEVVRSGRVLVCEGYTDVMALHQAGFANAVATCGTAVGREHLRVLARYADQIVLAFDADEAGHQAARRAWAELRALQADAVPGAGSPASARAEVRVLELPAGSDPADVVAAAGVDALRTAVDGATGIVPFLLARVVAAAELSTDEGRTAALRRALEVLRDEPDPELRRAYARTEIAQRIGISEEFVARTAARSGIELDRHEGVAQVGARSERGAAIADAGRRRARLERSVLRVALQRPDLLPDEWYDVVAEDFTHPRARDVFVVLAEAGGAGVAFDAILAAAPDDELRQLLRAMALEDLDLPADPELAARAARDLTRSVLVDRLVARQQALTRELERVHPASDESRWHDLNAAWQDLERRRRALVASDE